MWPFDTNCPKARTFLGYLPPKFITCPTCHWHANVCCDSRSNLKWWKLKLLPRGPLSEFFYLPTQSRLPWGIGQLLSVEPYCLQSVGVDKGAIRNLRVKFFGVIISFSLNNDNIAGSFVEFCCTHRLFVSWTIWQHPRKFCELPIDRVFQKSDHLTSRYITVIQFGE